MVSRLRSLLRLLRRRGRVDADMADEFRFHIECRTADLMRSGLPPREAARRARLEFGSPDRWAEDGRAARGLQLIDEVRVEVRQAVRALRRSPGFTVVAVLTLALGVGANAAVFGLVNASLLRPLPFDAPDRLVVVYQTHAEPGRAVQSLRFSFPEYDALRGAVGAFSGIAAYMAIDANLSGGTRAERVRVEVVSGSYFDVLGVRAAAGRVFVAGEDAIPGAHPVVVLGHDAATRLFGGAGAAVGRPVRLNGALLTVVGVLPAGFQGLAGVRDVWLPQAMAPSVTFANQLTSSEHFLSVVARLRPDATLERARAEVGTAGLRAAASARAAAGSGGAGTWGAHAAWLDDARRDPAMVRAHLVLAGIVAFVLLIAAVNLAALLLARSVGRARESALRAALGAGRTRLVWHALVEGALLGVFGAGLGVALAAGGIGVLDAVAPQRSAGRGPLGVDVASFSAPSVDWRVFAFATAVALAAGLVAALVPALRAAAGDLSVPLRSGARGGSVGIGTLRRPTLLSAAAVVQVGCAVVLLVGAALLVRAFERLRAVDPGFDPAGIITLRLSGSDREHGAAPARLHERILERVQALPGVASATVAFCPPFSRCSSTFVHFADRPESATPPLVGRHYVGPDHFRTLGIPLLRGRALTAEDRAGRPRVAVINETAARELWPGEDPIGRRVRFTSGGGFASPDSLTEIVGIVGDVLYGAPGDPVGPDFYTSYLQFTWPAGMLLVRTRAPPAAIVPALRAAVAAVDADLPVYDVRTLSERGADALAAERFATGAAAAFAGLGLLLAAIGVYGILAYSVAQRRREIGIRVALGASRAAVARLVVRQGLVVAAVGFAAGMAVALPLAQGLNALVRDAGSVHAGALAGVAAVLLGIAALASLLPARAAARVDPVATLAAD